MDKHYIVIAGSGETSRANVEALIEDYVYANGNEAIIILAYEKKPSAGQVFASQWAKDKSKDVVIFANSGASYDGISGATVNESKYPYEDAVSFIGKNDKAVGFILWNDIDVLSNDIAEVFKKRSIKCLDLTDGLTDISFSSVAKEEPTIPEAEMIVEKKTAAEPESEPFEDELEDEEMEDDELDEVYFGLQALVKAIAKAVVAELDASKKPSKGSQR